MMQRFSNKYLHLQVKINSYPLSLLIFSLSQSLFIFARSLTKIGQTSMNQALMVVATKSCALIFDLFPRIHVNRTLMIAATKFRSNFVCWNPYEASVNGCSHQVMFGFHLINTYYIYYYFFLFLFLSFFFRFYFLCIFFLKINISTYKSRIKIEREKVINLHKVLPSRLV